MRGRSPTATRGLAEVMARESREHRVEDVGHGDHLCLTFADDDEQRRVVTAYLRAGLERGERVKYFSDQCAPEQVLDWLDGAGTDPGPAVARGQLQITTAGRSYLAGGSFDADGMVATLQQEVTASLAAGYTGLRVSGEMGWALRDVPGADRLHEYEAKVNAVFDGSRASAVCQYDARRFDAETLTAVDRRHSGSVALEPLYVDTVLRLARTLQNGRLTLRVIGVVDHRTTGALASALETVSTWPGDVRVDMTQLEFIDLAGMRALAQAAGRLGNGQRMHVANLAELLCRVISVVGWDDEPALVVTPREAGA
ncbi:MEDS domain-containing protein [Amycolatopsis sp. A133]|uniref:MEDS domain-containing protein n=1 Tax=Amycolatopsis sp. A133 TaxID=3064472 RepID=UPI0027F7A05D|nr:MEDS domain-containing protein [Amycolatopsis sp. A133]MDQ7810828.1 MEDS domain-containing protein [Amycolatopsis sp. A133]